jgi:hypothetical protein
MLHVLNRSRILSLLTLLGALMGEGCGEPTCENPEGSLGSCCRSDVDCQEDLDCFDSFPAGLCSRDCEADRTCADSATCVRIESESSGILGWFCLADCGEGLADCRDGYGCRQTSVAEVRVCFPD